MNDENREPEPAARVGTPETAERSLDAVFQGAEALGVLAGGVGGLAAGVGKLKEAFGGGDQSSPTAASSECRPGEPERVEVAESFRRSAPPLARLPERRSAGASARRS
jgi:hypothetical protein